MLQRWISRPLRGLWMTYGRHSELAKQAWSPSFFVLLNLFQHLPQETLKQVQGDKESRIRWILRPLTGALDDD